MKNVKVDDEAHQLLKAVAAIQGRQVSDVASEAILQYCASRISRETRASITAPAVSKARVRKERLKEG